jgi:transmembrane sensor
MPDRPGAEGLEPELLDRYFAGECSEQEGAIVRRYLMARPDVASALSALLRQLDGEASRPAVPDAAASWELLRRRMLRPEPALPHAPIRSATRPVAAAAPRHPFAMLPSRRVPPWRRAAAVVCVVAGLAAAGVYRATRRPDAPAATRTSETFVTANRERAELRLSDGTRIHLAPASRLRVGADFGDTRRDVYLEGQGYFEVAHDARRPFSVFAGNATARDLGTEFAVRSYSDDDAVQVVVRNGAVELSRVGRLSAGDVGRLGADGTTSLTHGVKVDSLLGWLEGRLVFRDAPLSSVLRELRRWHDTDVQLADPALGTLPFTGVLTDDSFRSSISLVAATLGLRVRRAGNRVSLERIGGLTPSPLSPAARRAP